MDVMGAFLIFLFLESVLGSRMFRKMSKISKPTWNLATKKQISKPDRLQCALTCTGEKDVCNAVHFEALNNTCFIAKLTLLEEPPREESFPVYMETKALKSLEEKENFLLLGREVNCLQSFPCNFALPVLEFEFGLGGIAVLNGKFISTTLLKTSVTIVAWCPMEPGMKPTRESSTMTTVGDYILMTGGFSGVNLDTIERFDGLTWTTLDTKLASPTAEHCCRSKRYRNNCAGRT